MAFEAGLGEGIELGRLVPFHYWGIKDVVDYAPIPWRNRRFDPAKLARALQTQARMERLAQALEDHPGTRSLVFCCSIAHAVFAERWLREHRGLRVASVHSGPASADRFEAVDRLRRGDLDAICCVDLLNEGVDLPALDRVVMLRPTESPIVFLQQLGRGLRIAEGKDALTVVDFVGNHRVFLQRVRSLLNLGVGAEGKPIPLAAFLAKQQVEGLPRGCSVHIELEAIDMLRKLLPRSDRNALIQAYRELRHSRGTRPAAGELFRMGFNPRSLKHHACWFDFVRAEGDLTDLEASALDVAHGWLEGLERRESFTKSYKLVALQAMLDAGALLSGMGTDELARRSHQLMVRSPELLADLLPPPKELPDPLAPEPEVWRRYWEAWPLKHLAGGGRKGKRAWFRLEDGRFAPRFSVSPKLATTLERMTAELVDYHLARYRRRKRANTATSASEQASRFACRVSHNQGGPILRLPGRKKHPGLPEGWTDVHLPDGRIWSFQFVQVACNVARPVGSQRNELADLLRGWFGPHAGASGTLHHVELRRAPDGWTAQPVEPEGAQILPFPARGRLTAFRTLRAAAGWSSDAIVAGADGVDATTVTLPGEIDRERCFAIRATGASMEGWRSEIRDGDWLVMRWARGAGLGSVEGRVALLARGDADEGRTHHIKRVRRGPAGFELLSDNPEFPPMQAIPGDELLALLVRRVRPEDLAPGVGSVVQAGALAKAFGISEEPVGQHCRVDGHLFLLLEGRGKLEAPDRVSLPVPDRGPGETAYVLGRVDAAGAWTYLGVGRWRPESGAWEIAEVDFSTWRAFGKGRTASRRLAERWLEAADGVVAQRLTELGPGGWMELSGKRCRVLGRASRGGLRLDGGPRGMGERTVSRVDLAWVLAAQDAVARDGGLLDEARVNRLRYLAGTPKGSTRWIDTGWALVLAEGEPEI